RLVRIRWGCVLRQGGAPEQELREVRQDDDQRRDDGQSDQLAEEQEPPVAAPFGIVEPLVQAAQLLGERQAFSPRQRARGWVLPEQSHDATSPFGGSSDGGACWRRRPNREWKPTSPLESARGASAWTASTERVRSEERLFVA